MANKKSKPTEAAAPAATAADPASTVDTSSSTSASASASVSDASSQRASEAPSQGPKGASAGQVQERPTDFDSWYLRQMTAEFGDDLDKVRNANDFTDASLPILIQALKECSSVYTDEQKRKVMGLGGEDAASN